MISSLQISYAKGSLFPQFEPSYSIISLEEAQALLPSKESKSMRYAFGEAGKSGDWQQMGLFESFMKDGMFRIKKINQDLTDSIL